MKAAHSPLAAVCCVLVLIAALVGSANAANPAKGMTYSGTMKLPKASNVTYAISFQVSKNGKKVDNFSLPNGYPIYCQGGGFGEAQKATAKVSSKGTFTAKLPIYFAPTHAHEGFVKVTGKFGKKKQESGKVITEFSNSEECNGTSKYTAKAS
jgi:hypothetical protein